MTKRQWGIMGVLAAAGMACLGCLVFYVFTLFPSSERRVAILPTVSPMVQLELPTTTPARAPTLAATPTPKPLPPSERLATMAKDGLDKDSPWGMFMEFQSAAITGTRAVVAYKPSDDAIDQETTVTPYMQHLANIVPQVFVEFPAVDALEVNLQVMVKDIHGGSSEVVGIRVVITRATNAKIDWASFRPKNLPSVLTGKGDSIFVHSALSDGWATYRQKY